jgi:hypothetical protein
MTTLGGPCLRFGAEQKGVNCVDWFVERRNKGHEDVHKTEVHSLRNSEQATFGKYLVPYVHKL